MRAMCSFDSLKPISGFHLAITAKRFGKWGHFGAAVLLCTHAAKSRLYSLLLGQAAIRLWPMFKRSGVEQSMSNRLGKVVLLIVFAGWLVGGTTGLASAREAVTAAPPAQTVSSP